MEREPKVEYVRMGEGKSGRWLAALVCRATRGELGDVSKPIVIVPNDKHMIVIYEQIRADSKPIPFAEYTQSDDEPVVG